MITDFFERSHTITRLRSGSTGGHIDAFSDDLLELGYARHTGRTLLRGVAHLGSWLDLNGIGVTSLDEHFVDSFVDEVRSITVGHGKYRSCRAGGCRFLEWARRCGIVATRRPGSTDSVLIQDFEQWMIDHRNISQVTLRNYRAPLKRFVSAAGENPEHYTAPAIRQLILAEAQRGRGTASIAVSALRMLLRQLAVLGRCSPALIEAVPAIAGWKLAPLPSYLTKTEVEELIAACDTNSVAGRRDRAMILLMARLGLRSGDVLSLRLSDVDWPKAEISVSGKGRRVQRLPLPQDVGDAILAWLTAGRPPTVDHDHVFVRLRVPIGPVTNVAVNNVVVRAARRAGLAQKRVGPHMLRHSVATALLDEGMSLPGIGALLRHRNVDATVIYAKVDTRLLASVARPWPEEVGS